MSFSFSVPPVAPDEFAAAVRAAAVGGQSMADPDVATAVGGAKELLIELGGLVTRPLVGGSASGHVLEEGQGDTWHEGVTISVYGLQPVAAPGVTPA